ncbi:LOW QUALITY PROTEIN: hypothetical protein PHMEG_00026943 [Phytophthora megakarya]|uniref:ZSWIM1/3 RNaseH-like domain-containing protein n=1 Tax=Phytophthora megakarya TaxID=4795 RepID=A0A225V8D1_9STRA|nr:LOW QUALITY PROTEIN: hypothetical protein PHMEG_00026943 [Phytophthora megakarya]
MSREGTGTDESDQVRCPELEQTQFETWEAFQSYLESYQVKTFQVNSNYVYLHDISKSIFEKRRGPEQGDKSSSELSIYVDSRGLGGVREDLDCTHGGKYRYRRKRKQRCQEVRPIDCKVQVSLTLRSVVIGRICPSLPHQFAWSLNVCVREVNNSPSKFAVCVTKTFLTHNHRLGSRIYKQYPANRMSVDVSTMSTVDSLRKAGAKAKSILKFLVENTNRNPALKDVQNLIQTLKKRERGSTSCAHRLKDWMRQFCGESGNVGHIFVQRALNKKVGVVLHNFATCITLQTKHMLDIYRRFPEVLMIDATHGTNMSKYKIFSFMAYDVFGKGQYVQHAILENVRSEALFTAIGEFKTNPAWTKLQCAIVDKDFTEIAVLKAALPNVCVLLCQFHVVKYLREEIASANYGFSSWQKTQLRAIVNLLVYAEYNKNRQYLKHLTSIGLEPNYHTVSCGVGNTVTDQDVASRSACVVEGLESVSHPFETYFSRNWDNCHDLWCSYKQQNAVTLENNTNNRIESSWKHMKEVVKSSMSLDECLATIMFYQNQTETLLYDRAAKVSFVHREGYDREMSVIANLRACVHVIHEQYAYVTGPADYNFYEALPGLF